MKNTKNILSDFTIDDLIDEVESAGDTFSNTSKTNHNKPSARSVTSKKTSSNSIQFEILQNYGQLSNRSFAPYFCYINWNGYERYDIRAWKDNMTTPTKGVSFTKDELMFLLEESEEFNHSLAGKIVYNNYESGRIKAKIYDNICTFSETSIKGVVWKKQLNIVDWGYGKKYDFRKWTSNYDKCSKGVGITKEEFDNLLKLIKKIL